MTADHGTPWAWTEDPSDPCTLCLSWTGYDMENEGTPRLATGEVSPRVWRGIHPDCQKMVDEYEAEVRLDVDQLDGLVCPDCGGPGVTWEDGYVLCDDCARLRAKRAQMQREGDLTDSPPRCGECRGPLDAEGWHQSEFANCPRAQEEQS